MTGNASCSIEAAALATSWATPTVTTTVIKALAAYARYGESPGPANSRTATPREKRGLGRICFLVSRYKPQHGSRRPELGRGRETNRRCCAAA
jgi:hypothetical protein